MKLPIQSTREGAGEKHCSRKEKRRERERETERQDRRNDTEEEEEERNEQGRKKGRTREGRKETGPRNRQGALYYAIGPRPEARGR